MNTLYYSSPAPTSWEPRCRIARDHPASVAFSVAEAALNSGPNSPSFGQSMSQLMDSMPLGVARPEPAVVPRLKHKSSFAGRPLWDVVEHAKERREKRNISLTSAGIALHNKIPSTDVNAAIDIDLFNEVIVAPRSADTPVGPAFPRMSQLQDALPRMSAREFATTAEQKAAATAHGRTQSDALPSEVLRSQASHRPLSRLPSLAQIQAKMTNRPERPRSHHEFPRRPNGRSDSLDSNDSEGPVTPTEEWTSFDFRAPPTPETPSKELSRLAPFLRERTSSRLSRPKSMPPLSHYADLPPSPQSPMGAPASRPAPLRTSRQSSLPGTPQSLRRMPLRSWTADSAVTLIVTPPPKGAPSSPTSPTESEHSIVSSTFSLPIITCTPAGEEDSDEESEGDVVVFAGDLEDNDDMEELEELEEERRNREFLGREMLFRLSRRS